MKKQIPIRFLSLLLCIVLLLPTVYAAGSDFIIDKNGVLTKYVGSGGDVTIPDGVTSIGGSAFLGCSSLTSITIPDSVTSIESYAFSSCSNLTSITIPDSVTSIDAGAFYGCSNLTSVTIPDSITSISVHTFSGCSNLTSVTIPDSITSIGGSAFYGCSSLTSITIPDGVTYIRVHTFHGCSNLTSVIIPDSVTSISTCAFSDCSNLTSITIPDSVTSISISAFSGCSSLTSVTVPDSVISIGKNAFYNCNNLTAMSFLGAAPTFADDSIPDRSSLTAYYPVEEKESYETAKAQFPNVNWVSQCSEHSWGAWTITRQPTRTETGMAERVCQNDSSHTQQQELPALTDTSVWTAGEYKAPSCEADGYQKYTSEYGEITEALPAIGHTFEWIIDRPATMEAPGIKHEECTKCHEKRNENTEIPQLPIENYIVHYNANGGSGTMPDSTAPKDKEFTLPDNGFTAPAGKQFKCWAIGSADGTQIQPGAGFTFTGSTTVYAVWENIGFTIAFDKNGGSSVSAETMVTNPDGKLSKLPTAERSGKYRFKGWYTAKTGGTEVTEETIFTADTTVYAHWTYTGGDGSSGDGGGISVTRYTVTFDTQGGNEIESVRVTRNSTVVKPADPTREGYTFEGWFTDPECSEAYDFDTKVTKNITLYAKWVEKLTDPADPEDWENPFDDVDEDDWFYDDVKNAYENGWFTGVTNTSFAPNEAITRGMMVTVLYRAENEPATAAKSKFTDVAPDAYYTKAVIWAENNGIIRGYSEVEFAPDKLISREEMAAIMHRYADYKGADIRVSDDLMRFADQARIADWARENVAWAVGYGLLSGKDNNLLDPQGHTTRAETAAILNRFMKK